MRLAWTVVVAVAMLATPVAATAEATNVRGSVVRGPVTPVCRAEAPCSAPVAGLPLVFLASGVEVARVKTDGAGRFALALPPGTYAVETTRRLVFGGPLPRSFRVVAGRVKQLRLVIDTGIRAPIGGRPSL